MINKSFFFPEISGGPRLISVPKESVCENYPKKDAQE